MKRCFVRFYNVSGSHLWGIDPAFYDTLLVSTRKSKKSKVSNKSSDLSSSSSSSLLEVDSRSEPSHSRPHSPDLVSPSLSPTVHTNPLPHYLAGTTQYPGYKQTYHHSHARSMNSSNTPSTLSHHRTGASFATPSPTSLRPHHSYEDEDDDGEPLPLPQDLDPLSDDPSTLIYESEFD